MHNGSLIRYSCIYTALMRPALNGSSALQHFKHSNAVELCNGITFNFYVGLSHLLPQRRSNNMATCVTYYKDKKPWQ